MLRRGRHRKVRSGRIKPMEPRDPDAPLRDGDTVLFPGYDRSADILAAAIIWDTEATQPLPVIPPVPPRPVNVQRSTAWPPATS